MLRPVHRQPGTARGYPVRRFRQTIRRFAHRQGIERGCSQRHLGRLARASRQGPFRSRGVRSADTLRRGAGHHTAWKRSWPAVRPRSQERVPLLRDRNRQQRVLRPCLRTQSAAPRVVLGVLRYIPRHASRWSAGRQFNRRGSNRHVHASAKSDLGWVSTDRTLEPARRDIEIVSGGLAEQGWRRHGRDGGGPEDDGSWPCGRRHGGGHVCPLPRMADEEQHRDPRRAPESNTGDRRVGCGIAGARHSGNREGSRPCSTRNRRARKLQPVLSRGRRFDRLALEEKRAGARVHGQPARRAGWHVERSPDSGPSADDQDEDGGERRRHILRLAAREHARGRAALS